jgi:RNA polymerase sigma-70 factor (ECF subfamily)
VTAALADLLTIADPAGVPVDVSDVETRETPDVQALVNAARAGNRDAFGDLVRLNQRVVFRTALAALGAREDAEDAAQEAFIVAWRKLPAFRGDATFRTWLLTIVWRKALDRRRTRRLWWSRTDTRRPGVNTDPLDTVSDGSPDPERAAVSSDLATRISAEITLLSPKLRDTLVLAASGEHSYGDIAGILGVPLGTVKWRVTEARRILSKRVRRGDHD